MKYTTIHGIIKMRQLFCLVLDRRTLQKVPDEPGTYIGEFLVPENDIDWVAKVQEKIAKEGKIYSEWGNPDTSCCNDRQRLIRCSSVDISNTAAVIFSITKILDEIVEVRFSLREGKPTEILQDPNEPFIFTLRHISDIKSQDKVNSIVQIVSLDMLFHSKSGKEYPHVMSNPLPEWILQELHPELINKEENTMKNVNTDQHLVDNTVAVGVAAAAQTFDKNEEFQKVKDDTEIQHQEAEFNQPHVDNMILEEQEYGVKVIKIAPVIHSNKESLTDILDVMVINAAAGNTSSAIDEVEKDILRQTKIDLSECLELLDAVVFGDTIEMQDAMSDKRVTLNGFATFLPMISLTKNFEVTRDLLFTRFDSTIHNAVRTQEKYRALGIETYIAESIVNGNSYYANKVAEDVTGNDGEFYPRDKFLKSINYKKENFAPIGGIFDPEDEQAVSGRWNVIRKMLENFIMNTDAKVDNLVGGVEIETE